MSVLEKTAPQTPATVFSTSPLRKPPRVHAPCIGRVTGAGRSPGSRVAALVRPSQLPSGHFVDETLAAYSCGGSHGFPCKYGVRVPSFVSGLRPKNQHGRMFACALNRVKPVCAGPIHSHFSARARIKAAARLFCHHHAARNALLFAPQRKRGRHDESPPPPPCRNFCCCRADRNRDRRQARRCSRHRLSAADDVTRDGNARPVGLPVASEKVTSPPH